MIKRLISIIISIFIINMNCCVLPVFCKINLEKHEVELVEDSLIKNINVNIIEPEKYSVKIYEDKLLDNICIKYIEINQNDVEIIEDKLVEALKNINDKYNISTKNTITSSIYKYRTENRKNPLKNIIYVEDPLLVLIDKKKIEIRNYKYNNDYNENQRIIKGKIKSLEKLSTRNNKLYVGRAVRFVLKDDIKIDNENIIKAGTQIIGRIEFISKNSIKGVPAEIIVGDFRIKGNKSVTIDSEIKKKGFNHSVWVYPVSVVGSIFFGIGLLALLMPGGHAKIKPNKEYEITFCVNN